MIPHPAFSTVFAQQKPRVVLQDLRLDAVGATTYTFTACQLGDFGGTYSAVNTDSFSASSVRTGSKKHIVVLIHSRDAATLFTVNSATLGGVAGTEIADRGGATVACSSAIYRWSTEALADITGSNIVVTFSEAITACAISVLLVENVGLLLTGTTASGTATGTTAITMSATPATLAENTRHMLVIMMSTAFSSVAVPQFTLLDATSLITCMDHPTLLYHGNDGGNIINYSAAWSVLSHYPGSLQVEGATTGYSSSTNKEAVMWITA